MVGVWQGIFVHDTTYFAKRSGFFTYLLQDRKLSPRTEVNHKSAMNMVLKLSLDINISDDPTMTDLFKGFVAQTDPLVVLNWSLSVVLEALRQSPYEPQELASLQDWTKRLYFF